MKRNKNKGNYIDVPTNITMENKAFKVLYRRKYLDKAPKSCIYKLKKSLYLYIMNSLKNKPLNNATILNRADSIIIDKKYAKLYTLIANKYDCFEEEYERLANDLSFKIIHNLINTGKLSLSLAMSLFIFLNDSSLILDKGEPEQVYESYLILNNDNSLVLTEKPDDFISNIKLSDLANNRNLSSSNLVYTRETMKNHFLSPEKQKKFEFFVNEYAFYFNLNADYLIDVFKKATEEYSNLDLVIDSTRYDITNPETVAIMYVYFFWRNPKKYLDIEVTDYGYDSKDDFVTTDEIFIIEPNWMHDHVKVKTVKKEDITLRNGLSYSEYMGRMCNLLGIPEEYSSYVLGVSYAERGQFGSDNSIYKNNMGGLLDDEGNAKTFPSPEAGIIAFVVNLRRYEWDYHITDMVKFGNTYDGDEHVDQWVQNVSDFSFNISNDIYAYFLTEEENAIYLAGLEDLIFDNNTDYQVVQLSSNPTKILSYEDINDPQYE